MSADGILDVVIAMQSDASVYRQGAGDGTFSLTATSTWSASLGVRVTIADLDGDGDLDAYAGNRLIRQRRRQSQHKPDSAQQRFGVGQRPRHSRPRLYGHREILRWPTWMATERSTLSRARGGKTRLPWATAPVRLPRPRRLGRERIRPRISWLPTLTATESSTSSPTIEVRSAASTLTAMWIVSNARPFGLPAHSKPILEIPSHCCPLVL